MQVSATLIAAQQAAREARARLQVPETQQAKPAAKTDFAAALGDSFAALPLKQTAAPQAAEAKPAASGRMGQHVDITV